MKRAKTPSIFTPHAYKRPAEETMLTLWLKAHGVSKNRFGRLVGCAPRMVDLWCNGQAIPGLVYAAVIEKVTEGGVSMETWLGTELGKHLWKEHEKRIQANAS